MSRRLSCLFEAAGAAAKSRGEYSAVAFRHRVIAPPPDASASPRRHPSAASDPSDGHIQSAPSSLSSQFLPQLRPAVSVNTSHRSTPPESYMLALCESKRKEELVKLLEVIDIAKVSNTSHLSTLFKSLGKLRLDRFADEFLMKLHTTGSVDKSVSSFIYDYAFNIPNLAVEDTFSIFCKLHQRLELKPSIQSCSEIIKLCCNQYGVSTALEIADLICKIGLDVPINVLHPILQVCEQGEAQMVRGVYSLVRQHNLKPKIDTFRRMVSLFVHIRDFEGAYNALIDAEANGEISTVSLYNIIMAGYFRQKNNRQALMVFKQMKNSGVKPDSDTFMYLIYNSESHKEIAQYRDEMHESQVQVTKYVYMACINAYAKVRKFDLAKQVLSDRNMPSEYQHEMKNVLVAALAQNGQINEAIELYEEVKRHGGCADPKAILNIIQHHQTAPLERLLHLLGDLKDSSCWFDGCKRIIMSCVQNNQASDVVDLLKWIKEKDETSAYIVMDQAFSSLLDMEHINVQTGMEILRGVKQLGLNVSRTSLDFLLAACTSLRDYHCAEQIWAEYEAAGLPCNILTLLRLYQAFLAAGEHKAAKKILKRIPRDDAHVLYIISSCEMKYVRTAK